jgi:hypothetical protein
MKSGLFIRGIAFILYPKDSRGAQSWTLSVVLWLLLTGAFAFVYDVAVLKHAPAFLEFAGFIIPVFGLWGAREWGHWTKKFDKQS